MRARAGHPLVLVSAAAVVIVAALIYVAVLKWHPLQSELPVPPIRFIQANYPIDQIEYSRDGKHIITVGGGMVTFRDSFTGKVERQWPGGADRQNFSSDDRLMLERTLGGDGTPMTIVLRETMHGHAIRLWRGKLKGLTPNFSYMILLPESPALRETFSHRTVEFVDIRSGGILGRVTVASDAVHMNFSQTAKWLCDAHVDGQSHLYHVPDLRLKMSLPPLTALSVIDNDTTALGIAPDGSVHYWRLATGIHSVATTGLLKSDYAFITPKAVLIHGQLSRQQASCDVVEIRTPDGSHLIKAAQGDLQSYSVDGRFIGIASSDDRGSGRCYVLDSANGGTLAKLDSVVDSLGQTETGTDAQCVHYAISPDGNRIASGTASGLIRLYDLRRQVMQPQGPVLVDKGLPIVSFDGKGQGIVTDVAVDPSGGVLAVGGSGYYHDAMQIIRWKSGNVTDTITVTREIGVVERLGVSPDGVVVAAASHLGLWTHNLDTGADTMTAMPASLKSQSQAIGRPLWLSGPNKPISTVADNQRTHLCWDGANGDQTQHAIVGDSETIGRTRYVVSRTQASADGKLTIVIWIAGNPAFVQSRVLRPSVTGLLELRETETGRLIRRLDSAAENWKNWANADEAYRFGDIVRPIDCRRIDTERQNFIVECRNRSSYGIDDMLAVWQI